MQVTKRLVMDLAQAGLPPTVWAVQGDSGTRTLQLVLKVNGLDWEIPAGAALLVRYRRSDGTGGVYDTLPDGAKAWSVQGNVLTVTLAPQVTAVSGAVELALTLVEGLRQLSTFCLSLQVSRLPGGSADSRDYCNLAAWLGSQHMGGGVSLSAAVIDGRGHLMLTLSSGTVLDAGRAVPQRGVDYWTPADQEQILAQAAGPRPNLLDNSDFTCPVNQRCVSGLISAAGYFLDRWKLVSGTVTVGSAGLTLNGVICQILERDPGEVTAACSGGAEAAFDRGSRTFTLTGRGALVTWAALYPGSGPLPGYVPKGYGQELLECQRYFRQLNVLFGTDVGTTQRQLTNCIPTMRVSPTAAITITGGDPGAGYCVNSISPDLTDITFTSWGTANLVLSADL